MPPKRKKVLYSTYDLSEELGNDFAINGKIESVSEDFEHKFIKILKDDTIYPCIFKSKKVNFKKGNDISIEGVVVEIEDDGKTKYYIEIVKIEDEKYATLEGIEKINVRGIIKHSHIQEEYGTFFDIMVDELLYPCHIESEQEFLEGDKIEIVGYVENREGFALIDVIRFTIKCELNISNLIEMFLTKDQDKIDEIIEKIVEYTSFGYKSIEHCLHDLSLDLFSFHKDKIGTFTEHIFTNCTEQNIKEIEGMVHYFRQYYVFRPFFFFNIKKEKIEEIEKRRNIFEVYELIFTNPAKIVEFKKKEVDDIFFFHLRRDPTEEEETAGNIGRYIYESLMKKRWTSVPIKHLEKAFPTSFVLRRDILKDYCCSEYLSNFYYTPILQIENFVALKIFKLMTMKIEYNPSQIFNENDKILTVDQNEALLGSLKSGISIITGGAGTGKTKILSDMAEILVRDGYKPMYLAYVGAAVQRIKESFKEKSERMMDRIFSQEDEMEREEEKKEGDSKLEKKHVRIDEVIEIMTIHLAIAKKDSIKGITHVIFDECSMIDLELIYNFMDAFSNIINLKYIFVGDINQLEPIAPGNLMSQLLKVGVPVYRLTENFRNERGILEVVETIIDPERIAEQRPMRWRDYNFRDVEVYQGKMEKMYEKIEDQYFKLTDEEMRSKKQIVEFLDKITVVTYHRDTCEKINAMFQEIFLEGFNKIEISRRVFYERDRVMNLKNNYSMNVMNGEVGNIMELNKDYIAVKYKECNCVYFTKEKHRDIKAMLKKIKFSYSCFDKSGKVKNQELINSELEKEKEIYIKTCKDLDALEDLIFYIDVAKKYPESVLKDRDLKCNKLLFINQAYCMTVRKAQGSQFRTCICYQDDRVPYYINRRVIYTEMSRAKKKLIIVCSSVEKLNSAILNKDSFVYDNLWFNIFNRLPEEMKIAKEEEKQEELLDDQNYLEPGDDFDDVDLDDIF